MDYIKKNCTLILLLLLVLVIIISLFTGCKCNEGYQNLIEDHSNHGEKYLKKLTTADSAITAGLKASGGESISSLLGDDDDDDDDDHDDDDDDDGIFGGVL